MTNGEKIKEIFPNLRITVCEFYVQVMGEQYEFSNTYPLKWWNTEYQEPTTKIRPKGHWIEHLHEWGDNWQYSQYECSCCHNWAHFDTDYCPNCGADMREVEE